MKFIDPKEITSLENYKLLIGSVIPRPIAFVTSISEEGIVNGAPFSYFNVVNSNPPLVSISINREGGELKDTAKNILSKKEFVVHLVNSDNVRAINETSARLPYNTSEIEKANLTLVDSTNVLVPGIKESKVKFECSLVERFEIKDGDIVVSDLVIGRVIGYHFDEDIIDNYRTDPVKLDPISRLAGSNYSMLGEIFSLKRPK